MTLPARPQAGGGGGGDGAAGPWLMPSDSSHLR